MTVRNIDLALMSDREARDSANRIAAWTFFLFAAGGVAAFFGYRSEGDMFALLSALSFGAGGLLTSWWVRWGVLSHRKSLQRRHPLDARFPGYLEDTVAKMERVVDPADSIMALTTVRSEQGEFEAALTGQRLYLFRFADKGSSGYALPEIVEAWDTQIRGIKDLQHQRLVDLRSGETTGYRIIVPSATLPVAAMETSKHDAQEFVQALDAAVARARGVVDGGRDLAAQIDALNSLKEEGVISAAEFSRAKELYVGKAPDAQALAAQRLRSLKALHSQGLLTDAELAAKKWDALALA